MGLKLSQLEGGSALARLGVAGRTVRRLGPTEEPEPNEELLLVTYDVERITPAAEDLFRTAQEAKGAGGLGALLVIASDILISWDVLDDDGQPIPTDAEHLAHVPAGFLARVLGAVFSEAKLDPEASASSE